MNHNEQSPSGLQTPQNNRKQPAMKQPPSAPQKRRGGGGKVRRAELTGGELMVPTNTPLKAGGAAGNERQQDRAEGKIRTHMKPFETSVQATAGARRSSPLSMVTVPAVTSKRDANGRPWNEVCIDDIEQQIQRTEYLPLCQVRLADLWYDVVAAEQEPPAEDQRYPTLWLTVRMFLNVQPLYLPSSPVMVRKFRTTPTELIKIAFGLYSFAKLLDGEELLVDEGYFCRWMEDVCPRECFADEGEQAVGVMEIAIGECLVLKRCQQLRIMFQKKSSMDFRFPADAPTAYNLNVDSCVSKNFAYDYRWSVMYYPKDEGEENTEEKRTKKSRFTLPDDFGVEEEVEEEDPDTFPPTQPM